MGEKAMGVGYGVTEWVVSGTLIGLGNINQWKLPRVCSESAVLEGMSGVQINQ